MKISRWVLLGGAVALVLWLAQDCSQRNRDEWEGKVQSALKDGQTHEAESAARRDSLARLRSTDSLLRDSLNLLKSAPSRILRILGPVRDSFVTDSTTADSLHRALRVIAHQDTALQGQQAVIAMQDRRIGVLEGSGRLWEVQRQADSSRIAQLEGLLRDRPRDRWLGFIPKPKCGPGPGFGTALQAEIVFACILPL